MELFDYEHHELVAKLVLNRDRVVWVTRWRRAAEDKDERTAVEREMRAAGQQQILQVLRARETGLKTEDAGRSVL
jgi:pre-mRNA-splicing helicase BRR2